MYNFNSVIIVQKLFYLIYPGSKVLAAVAESLAGDAV
jgi:hypothetical protein